MKTVIHPRYEQLRLQLTAAAQGCYTPERTFCNARNTVELFSIDGQQFVIKKYKKTDPATGLIYSIFRHTKARRAYDNALLLIENGFNTAFPVAYFEKKRFGIFHEGIFISEYLPLPQVSDMLFSDIPFNDRYWLCRNLSFFTLSLHQKGIVPIDFNASNIMFERPEHREFRFYLIDINRMETGRIPSLKKAMRAFFQLCANVWTYGTLLQPYAEARGFEFDDCIYHIIRARRRWNRLHSLKHLCRW